MMRRAAGAIGTPDSIARGRAPGLDSAAAQRHRDSASFFDAIGDLITTGPTRTNVKILVLRQENMPRYDGTEPVGLRSVGRGKHRRFKRSNEQGGT